MQLEPDEPEDQSPDVSLHGAGGVCTGASACTSEPAALRASQVGVLTGELSL